MRAIALVTVPTCCNSHRVRSTVTEVMLESTRLVIERAVGGMGAMLGVVEKVQGMWISVVVVDGHENAVAARLRELGVPYFLPAVSGVETTRSPGRRVDQGIPYRALKPLYKGYLFAFVDTGGSDKGANTLVLVRGVKDVLSIVRLESPNTARELIDLERVCSEGDELALRADLERSPSPSSSPLSSPSARVTAGAGAAALLGHTTPLVGMGAGCW